MFPGASVCMIFIDFCHCLAFNCFAHMKSRNRPREGVEDLIRELRQCQEEGISSSALGESRRDFFEHVGMLGVLPAVDFWRLSQS